MVVNIQTVLVIWAEAWAREKGCKGYPSLQSFAREMPRVVKHRVMRLSDENCLEIDRLVMKLHDFNLEQYQILMARYLQGVDDKTIWRTMEISKKTFYTELKAGFAFLIGGISALEMRF